MLLVVVLVALFSLCVVQGHICILDPQQRGNFSIAIPGDPTCFRRTPYCGNIAPDTPPYRTYEAGTEIFVLFQQNLNHWYPENPGYFDISLSYDVIEKPDNATWIVLGNFSDFAAHDMVTQTNFSVKANLPRERCVHCVLRARYVSHNVDEQYPANNTEAIFYNCADITIVPHLSAEERAQNEIHHRHHHQHSKSEKQHEREEHTTHQSDIIQGCCTPPQWEIWGYEENFLGETTHHIYYDSVLNFVRWDREGNLENSSVISQISVITNYTPMANGQINEYLIYPNKCELYGADTFYPWCYGAQASQQFVQNFSINGATYVEWEGLGNDFTWTTVGNNCMPFSQYHMGSSVSFFTANIGPIDPSVFQVPAMCNDAQVQSTKHHTCHPRFF